MSEISYCLASPEEWPNPNAPHYKPYLQINLPEKDIKRLQTILRVIPDGKIGEQTIIAMYCYIANSKEYQEIAYKIPIY